MIQPYKLHSGHLRGNRARQSPRNGDRYPGDHYCSIVHNQAKDPIEAALGELDDAVA